MKVSDNIELKDFTDKNSKRDSRISSNRIKFKRESFNGLFKFVLQHVLDFEKKKLVQSSYST